jgi:hypothetical protein
MLKRFWPALLIAVSIISCVDSTKTQVENDEKIQTIKPLWVDGPPNQVGKFLPVQDNWGNTGKAIVPLHAVLLPTGNVLTFGGEYNPSLTRFDQTGLYLDLWNPVTNQHSAVSRGGISTNVFCSSPIIDPNTGNIMILGGDENNPGKPSGAENVGIRDVNIYNLSSNSLSQAPSMIFPRWYATATTLSDKRIFAQGGKGSSKPPNDPSYSRIPEVFSPSTGWTSLNVNFNQSTYSNNQGFSYPRSFLMPNGYLLSFSGDSSKLWWLSPDQNSQSLPASNILPVKRGVFPGLFNDTLPAVMYEPGKILAFMYGDTGKAVSISTSGFSVNVQEITRSPAVAAPTTRYYSNMTLLPNGNVFVNGGSAFGNNFDQAYYNSEIWQPSTTGTWVVTNAANAKKFRLYHSASLLLPNGKVFTGGGGAGPIPDNANSINGNNANAEIYEPPYLFNADGTYATRPVITSIPNQILYNSTVTISSSNAPNISKVSLIKLGAATHAFNPEQRLFWMNITNRASQSLMVTTPLDAYVATPGYYMISILNQQGVPSESKIVYLSGSKPIPDSNLIPKVALFQEIGTTLTPDKPMQSVSKLFSLYLQSDGNMVEVRQSDGAVIWTSATFGKFGTSVQMQPDTLVLSRPVNATTATAVWATNAYPPDGLYTTLNDNGEFVVKSESGGIFWSNKGVRSQLLPDEQLRVGQRLLSPNGLFFLELQRDGNLVSRRRSDNFVVWNSQTSGAEANLLRLYQSDATYIAAMQSDGNFVLYGGGTPRFSTSTYNSPGAKAVFDNSGILRIVNTQGNTIWTY